MNNRIEILEKSLKRLLYWIAGVDSKIPPVIVINTSMLGILATLSSKVRIWTIPLAIFVVLSCIPLIYSLIMLFLTSFPRTKGTKDSIIFFDGISSMDETDYLNKIKNINDEDYENDLAQQCHINALIATEKFKFLKSSFISLFLSIIPWIIAVYLLFRNKV